MCVFRLVKEAPVTNGISVLFFAGVLALVAGCGDNPADPTISLECRQLYAAEENKTRNTWGYSLGVTSATVQETAVFRRSLRKWCEEQGVKP